MPAFASLSRFGSNCLIISPVHVMVAKIIRENVDHVCWTGNANLQASEQTNPEEH
jgi:hypothetical protein